MSDPLESAFDAFADAAEEQLARMAEQIRVLSAEVERVRTEARTASLEVRVPPPAPEPAPGPQGERGTDGRGIAALEIRDGVLVVRYTDGEEQAVGRVVGEQGERGEPGERGADGTAGRDGAPGPQGERGERGADGIATREEIEALIEARFADLQVRTLADTYRDVFRVGESYRRGQMATWDGSLFLALVDTQAKPLESPDWKLVTKKGRDGRDRTR